MKITPESVLEQSNKKLKSVLTHVGSLAMEICDDKRNRLYK